MQDQRLFHLPADGARRVKRILRVLHHHRHAVTAQLVPVTLAQRQRSSPATWSWLACRCSAGESKPIRPRAVSDLPEPDSPTSATRSRPTERLMSIDQQRIVAANGQPLGMEQIILHDGYPVGRAGHRLSG